MVQCSDLGSGAICQASISLLQELSLCPKVRLSDHPSSSNIAGRGFVPRCEPQAPGSQTRADCWTEASTHSARDDQRVSAQYRRRALFHCLISATSRMVHRERVRRSDRRSTQQSAVPGRSIRSILRKSKPLANLHLSARCRSADKMMTFSFDLFVERNPCNN